MEGQTGENAPRPATKVKAVEPPLSHRGDPSPPAPESSPPAPNHSSEGESGEDEEGWTHSRREAEGRVEEPAVEDERPARRRSSSAGEYPCEPAPALEEALALVPEEAKRLLDELLRGKFTRIHKIDKERWF